MTAAWLYRKAIATVLGTGYAMVTVGALLGAQVAWSGLVMLACCYALILLLPEYRGEG